MAKRVNEIDVKLLLFALQKTSQFEDLLSKRLVQLRKAIENLRFNHVFLDLPDKRSKKHLETIVKAELNPLIHLKSQSGKIRSKRMREQ